MLEGAGREAFQPAATQHDLSPIVLAHENPFRIGTAEFRPATRELLNGGQRSIVEPRVMQVLVALHRAGGSVLSKDDLALMCWNGRIVGEDAMNRIISRVRSLASTRADGQFRVQTIPKVGYRLIEAEPRGRPGFGRNLPKPFRSIAAGLLFVLALAGLFFWWRLQPANAEPAALAVLPFKNLAPGDGYFAEGVAEGIANQLAREPQFKVAGRTSSELLKDAADLREVGRKLHVRYVLEGSVRSAGEQVRVDVSLVDTRKGMRLWSENFQGSLDDIFAIQDRIGQQVAVHVRRQLVRPPSPRGTTTTRGDVYSLYLTARGLMGTREPAKLHSAVQLLRQAVKLDPNFAPAWAQLAQAQRFEWQRSRPAEGDLASARQQWLRIASHALQLAPDSADAHLAMCYILSSYTGATTEYEARERFHCRRAAELDQNSGEVWDSIAQGREFEGDYPGALEAYRRLYSIEPLWWHAYGGVTILSWRMGYRDEARRAVRQTAEDASAFSGNMARALLATEEGDWSAALKWLQAARAVAEPSEKQMVDMRVATVLRSLGELEQARPQFPYYEVDSDMWLMWNGKAPTPQRVAELGRSPVKLWQSTKMYFLIRTLLKEGRSAEVLWLYDRRFNSPEELHATLHQASPELILAMRDRGRRGEAERMAKLAAMDAQRVQSHGRVPFGFHYERSLALAAEGKHEQAITALQKAVRLGWLYANELYSFQDIEAEPVFRAIKSDWRFQQVRAHFSAHRSRERREAGLFAT